MLGIARTMKPLFAILLILSILTLTSALPRTRKAKHGSFDETKLLTNSARFRAGLGPLKPRSMYPPTRVKGAHSASPSPSPQYTARMFEVRSMDNMSMGFVSNKISERGSFVGLTQNHHEKLVVKYMTASMAPSPLNLAINGKYPFLGFSGENLAPPNALAHSYFVETERTPPRSPPQAVSSSSQVHDKSESSIWSYNKQSRQLTAQWTNVDGTSPPSIFWYYKKEQALGLVNCTSSDSSLGQQVLLYLV